MNTWTPLWSKIVDSSIWAEPDYVVKVFLTLLAKKDHDHIVRGTAYNIALWSRKTEKETLDALQILSSPDTKRIEPQPHEGRRIEKVEDGWLILNSGYYRDLLSKAVRREKQKVWQADYRDRKKDEQQGGGRFSKPTVDDLVNHGLSAFEADKFIDYYDSKGWKVGKSPMKDWRAAASGWKRRSVQFSNNGQNPSNQPENDPMPDNSDKKAMDMWIRRNVQC